MDEPNEEVMRGMEREKEGERECEMERDGNLFPRGHSEPGATDRNLSPLSSGSIAPQK